MFYLLVALSTFVLPTQTPIQRTFDQNYEVRKRIKSDINKVHIYKKVPTIWIKISKKSN